MILWEFKDLKEEEDAVAERQSGQVAAWRRPQLLLCPHDERQHVSRHTDHIPDRSDVPVDDVNGWRHRLVIADVEKAWVTCRVTVSSV